MSNEIKVTPAMREWCRYLAQLTDKGREVAA